MESQITAMNNSDLKYQAMERKDQERKGFLEERDPTMAVMAGHSNEGRANVDQEEKDLGRQRGPLVL